MQDLVRHELVTLTDGRQVDVVTRIPNLTPPPSGGDEPSPTDGCGRGGFIIKLMFVCFIREF